MAGRNPVKLVILETPYAGDVEANLTFARACMADCFKRGEAPFASHLLYTQPGILDDTKPEERTQGINAGFEWAEAAWGWDDCYRVVYVDRGISSGMQAGINHAKKIGQTLCFRKLALSPWNGTVKTLDMYFGPDAFT